MGRNERGAGKGESLEVLAGGWMKEQIKIRGAVRGSSK